MRQFLHPFGIHLAYLKNNHKFLSDNPFCSQYIKLQVQTDHLDVYKRQHLDVSPEVKRLFIDQIKLITWANKLSPQTMNLGAGQTVTEIEVFHIRLTGQELDKRTLELMDRQIPYHILFVLERPDGQMQLRISYKEAAQSGDNAFRLRQSYATEFAPPESLTLPLDALDMDSMYASIVRVIAGDALAAPEQPLEPVSYTHLLDNMNLYNRKSYFLVKTQN